jgi:hypothetical protein
MAHSHSLSQATNNFDRFDNMHGFYRLNILRAFTISTLLLISATAALVIVTNFRDNNVHPSKD